MRFQGISQFYLHTPRSSANGINHTCLCLPSRRRYPFTDPGGMEGWVGLGCLIVGQTRKGESVISSKLPLMLQVPKGAIFGLNLSCLWELWF